MEINFGGCLNVMFKEIQSSIYEYPMRPIVAMSITDKVTTMKVIAVENLVERILQTTTEGIARTTELGMPYEVDSIKAELENKLRLMLISRTFARRLGQTRHMLVTYLEDPKTYTLTGASSLSSSLSSLKRQLSHISITEG